jgi:acetate kinase
VLKGMPDVPQVACFDTAFHHTNPPLAQMFALPKALTDAGLRRYGFHGLSYEYISSVLAARAPQAAAGKTVVLHLGNGPSMCALAAGKSVASTMEFSALDGLPMGTRCGALDPGVILFLLDQKKMDLHAIEKLLYSESGLLGVSGISSDRARAA